MRSIAILALLAVGVIAVQPTGMYSVVKNGDRFSVEKGSVSTAVASVDFTDALLTTGWDQLKMRSSNDFSADDQAYALGFGEGYVLSTRIVSHRNNIHFFMLDHYVHQTSWPSFVEEYVAANWKWTTEQAAKHAATDDFWYQVSLFVAQARGIRDGLNAQYGEEKFSELDMAMYLASGDLLDIVHIKKPSARINWEELTPEERELHFALTNHCSGLIRLSRDKTDVYVSQAAWFTFASMTRVLKTIEFGWVGFRGQNAKVMTFSSYPGFIQSFDDIYVSSTGLAVFETTNAVFDTDLYDLCVPESLLTWVRAPQASRVATSALEWAEIFSDPKAGVTGTYNNQWCAVDYNKLGNTPNAPLKAGTLVILEQLPGRVEYTDATKDLESLGYIPSYNINRLPTMFSYSGNAKMAETDSSWSYEGCPRANIFRDQIEKGNVDSYEGFRKVMRYNNWKEDKFSLGDAGFAIASRYDLRTKNSVAFGEIDSKTVRKAQVFAKDGPRIDAVAGPTTSHGQPVWTFDEKEWADVKHEGLPSGHKYEYDWVFDFGF